MPTILRRLPFYSEKTTLRLPDGPAIEIKHDQIVLWVSVAIASQLGLSERSRRIPAVVDLGFNDYFLIREDHIREWAKTDLNEKDFPLAGTLKAFGVRVPLFDADIWIHPNLPGFRDQFSDKPPVRLLLETGIAVCPDNMKQVRLPLLGLSALRKNGLRLLVNGEKKYISLRSPLQ